MTRRARLRAGFGAAMPLALLAAFASCAHEERRPVVGPPMPKEQTVGVPSAPPQYVVADQPSGRRTAARIPIGSRGAEGVIVDRRRIVMGQGEPRVASDTTPEPLHGGTRVPGRFGGGFLFWTERSLYRADAFDAKLVPVTRVPETIERISFGPKSAVVRTRNGERWSIALPSGARAQLGIHGLADVGALDDGRAVAMTEQGTVLTSIDLGAHWTDATTQIKASPERVVEIGEDLWVFDANNGASRLEPDGRLAWFEKQPTSEELPQRRPKDPRWRSNDTPLHAVLRKGVALDESSAVVIEGGDVYRVDVHTGEVLSATPGNLPPDAECEGMLVNGDVVFACVATRGNGSTFVVSRTLGAYAPTVEQTFEPGGVFHASDDGGLLYVGTCQGALPGAAPASTVCVRTPGGGWEQRDVSGLVTDGGAGNVNVSRWIPRGDGRAVAVVTSPTAGLFDPQLGTFQTLPNDARDALNGNGLSGYAFRPGSKPGKAPILRAKRTSLDGLVDTSWSFDDFGGLRGWSHHGESFRITPDGKLEKSPWAFDSIVDAGALGLGRTADGRLYQSNDHGASWTEVAAPPTGDALDFMGCSSAGCDLGAFYRIGWALRPPHVDPPRSSAPGAPEIRRTRSLELACRPQGSVTSKMLPRTNDSPEDLGLGLGRLPVAGERTNVSYVRNVVNRTIVSPIRDASSGDSEAANIRAIFSGYGTTRDGDTISVSGPNKSALALRRGFAYAPPFEPTGRIVRTSIAMSDVVAAGRRAGMTLEEILSEDVTETGSVVPLTPPDGTAPGDVVVHGVEHGLVAIVRGDRVRVAMRAPQNNYTVISGVLFGGMSDEAALLELDSTGLARVFKVGANGASDLFDVNLVAGEPYYPANPDALAIGAKNELAVIRTPSGSDPPSAEDPALLLVPSMPPSPLAPWSQLELADSAACKAETGGHRATLSLVAPWIRVTTPELRVEDGPMLARVRWTQSRVCLEGFEVRLPPVTVRAAPTMGSAEVSLATWLVARGSTFARVGVADGVEWRQPLECTVATPSRTP